MGKYQGKFEKYFSMYANAESNLLINGFKTSHEKDEITIYYEENLIGKLVHDSEKNHPVLYLNQKDQGEVINGVKVGIVKYLMGESWPVKPVDF